MESFLVLFSQKKVGTSIKNLAAWRLNNRHRRYRSFRLEPCTCTPQFVRHVQCTTTAPILHSLVLIFKWFHCPGRSLICRRQTLENSTRFSGWPDGWFPRFTAFHWAKEPEKFIYYMMTSSEQWPWSWSHGALIFHKALQGQSRYSLGVLAGLRRGYRSVHAALALIEATYKWIILHALIRSKYTKPWVSTADVQTFFLGESSFLPIMEELPAR